MMKILQQVPYFYPAWSYGGPGKLVYDISLYFSQLGHKVTVFTGDGYDASTRMSDSLHVHKKNLKVHYFRNLNNYLAYHYNVFFTPGFYFPALQKIKSFDVIHIHDFYTLQNFFTGLVASSVGVPYILSVHGCLEDERVKQKGGIKKIFLQVYGYRFIRNAARVIATSPNEIESYLSVGVPRDKIVHLAHGISLDEFTTTVSKATARKKLNLPPNKHLITFLGRIHKIKGLDKLAETIKLLKSKKDVHFVIAGSDDGYLETLQHLLTEYKLTNVTLMGTCFGEQKKLLFKASDAFIYPSYSEGFSLGILEAAAAGLPLIVSTGCHFDEVETAKVGIVTDNNPQALKKAIITMTENKEFRIQAAKNAQKLIKKNYSMEAIGTALLKVYSDVLQS